MRCPKCEFDHELQTTECLKCGIVFSRYRAAMEAAAKQEAVDAVAKQAEVVEPPPEAMAMSSDEAANERNVAMRELKYRVLALPVALLVARGAVSTGFDMVAGMLTMVLHESGHAITAWLVGRWAVPLLWVTMHGEERSWLVVLVLLSAIGGGGFLAWKARRLGWVGVACAALVVQLIFLSLPHPEALIVFGGDGGALVLATILMAMFYAPRDSAVYKSWGLRWGLLAIGALSFMHVFREWSGPIEDLPFGEIEGVNLSDPSLMTEMYGWTVTQLIDRYLELATVCLVALGAVYVWGLVSAYWEMRRAGPQVETGQGSRVQGSAVH